MMDVLVITSSVLVVTTNISVCCMVVFIRRLRTFTNYFVASLALSDILIGGVLLPMHLPGTSVSPVAAGYLVSIILVSGVANLCAVTWDRYLAIISPLRYTERLRRSYKYVLVMTWVFAVSYSLLPLIWHSNLTSLFHKCYLVFSMIVCVVVPYVLIVVAYVRIFSRLRKHIKQLKMFNVSRRKREGARKASIEGKTVNVFIIVIAVFILSWTPVLFMTLAEFVFDRADLIPAPLPFVSLLVLSLSSLVNPFLYAFMKRDFTRELLRIFVRRKTLLESSSQSSSHGSLRSYLASLGRRMSRNRRATVTGAETRKKISTALTPPLQRHQSEPRIARKISRGSEKQKGNGTSDVTTKFSGNDVTRSADLKVNDVTMRNNVRGENDVKMERDDIVLKAETHAYENVLNSVNLEDVNGGKQDRNGATNIMTSHNGYSMKNYKLTHKVESIVRTGSDVTCKTLT